MKNDGTSLAFEFYVVLALTCEIAVAVCDVMMEALYARSIF